VTVLCIIWLMSTTNMGSYLNSSVTRDVSDETAWRWPQMWTETCSNYQMKRMWAVFFLCCVDGQIHQSWYTTGCKHWRSWERLLTFITQKDFLEVDLNLRSTGHEPEELGSAWCSGAIHEGGHRHSWKAPLNKTHDSTSVGFSGQAA
jgi:hypothetical protein